ncbi:MAG: 5-formyltetrahydrofolate cyclo-ligase [Firmicutes bacterium]|nr:5-formyltetrahydrofolate cyclo-ligase [Bacillota bacterium]
MESKEELRKKYKSKRNQLSFEKRKRLSEIIIHKIKSTDVYINAKTIALFYPIQTEVDLLDLLEDGSKRFCFPRVTDQLHSIMEFIPNSKNFKKGPFDLFEPIGNPINATDIDLILIPGLVFSRGGYRIGYGKGYYDLYLKAFKGNTMGIGFQIQLASEIEHNYQDVRLSMILTDREVLCILQ